MQEEKQKISNALRQVCTSGKLQDISKLVKKEGKDVLNSVDSNLQTPLHLVCEGGYEDVVEYFLSDKFKGIFDVNALDIHGWTPLHSACQSGNYNIIQLLVSKGAFARALSNECSSPLHYFVLSNNQNPLIIHKTINLLISKGNNIDMQNKIGETALHQAAINGVPIFIIYLLNNKANPNLTNM